MNRFITFLFICAVGLQLRAIDHPGLTVPRIESGRFTLVENGLPTAILSDTTDNSAVRIAVGNLQEDFRRVTG